MKSDLTIEVKEHILLKTRLKLDDVKILTGYERTKAGQVMAICKRDFNGEIKGRSDVITTKSLCLYLGTTLEEEMRLLGIAKGFIQI